MLLRNDGGALLVKPIRGELPGDLRARLIAQKQEALGVLTAPAARCPGCGVRLGKPVPCYWCRKPGTMARAA